MANASIGLITGGRGFGLFNKLDAEDGHKQMKKGLKSFDKYDGIKYDGKYILDKVTDVYYSATSHDEDQVPHLHIIDPSICIEKCKEEFGNPCKNFCPANVYEIVDDGQERLQINFSNCVHCKTCDIMDPYQIIDWVTPEGGDGPSWKNM
jgi:electron-transferring-flavoprotein dehydrogenase